MSEQNKILSRILEMFLQVYGYSIISRTRVFEWHKWFTGRGKQSKNDCRSKRPSQNKTEVNKVRLKQVV